MRLRIFGVRSSSFLLIILALLLAVAIKECAYEGKGRSFRLRSFVLQFPDHADLGELRLVEDVNCFTCGNGQTNVGRAMGEHEIRLPEPHWYVSLKMPKRAALLMAHFRGWKRSTIRLVPYQWGDRKNTSAEQRLLDEARAVICDDQPEEICGVQIR